MQLENASHFFATAREREYIRLRREAGLPREEWTKDWNFQQWRFCNVHRENDKTTAWFRENIRDRVNANLNMVQVLRSTIIFRWFNRIETGEIILDLLVNEWDTEEARRRLTGVRPIVTGAYIVKGPDGFDKLSGLLFCIDQAEKHLPAILQDIEEIPTLENAWGALGTLYYLGPFMAYEVVSDLRWTRLLYTASDIMTWANAGPGCTHGLGRVINGNPKLFNKGSKSDQRKMLEAMGQLLEMSHDPQHWPAEFQPWEMREVEHWLCEYDKYVRSSQGIPMKRKFR